MRLGRDTNEFSFIGAGCLPRVLGKIVCLQ